MTEVVCLWLCVLSQTTFIGNGTTQAPLALPEVPAGTLMAAVPSWKLNA